jgi:hypothetical protein
MGTRKDANDPKRTYELKRAMAEDSAADPKPTLDITIFDAAKVASQRPSQIAALTQDAFYLFLCGSAVRSE